MIGTPLLIFVAAGIVATVVTLILVMHAHCTTQRAIERGRQWSKRYRELETLEYETAKRRCFALMERRTDLVKVIARADESRFAKRAVQFGDLPESVTTFFSTFARVVLFESLEPLTLELRLPDDPSSEWIVIGEHADSGTYAVRRDGDAVFNLDREISENWVKLYESIYHMILSQCAEHDGVMRDGE